MVGVSKNQKLVVNLFNKTMLVFLLAELVPVLCTVMDSMLIGKFLGVPQVAAFGLLLPYLKMVSFLPLAVGLGMQICCAKSLGEGDFHKAKGFFSLAISLTFIFSVLELLGTLFFSEQLLQFLGTAGKAAEVKYFAASYLKGYAIGLPAVCLVCVLISVMQLDNDKSRSVRSTLILSVVNIIGDFANIFYFKNDMWGMALATTIANYIALIYLLLHFLKPDKNLSYEPKAMQLSFIKDIVLNGSQILIGRLSSTGRVLFLNKMALVLGGLNGLAAYSIVENFIRILNEFPKSMGATTRLLSGIYLGNSRGDGIHKTINYAIKLSLIISLVVVVVVFSSTPLIVSLYTDDRTQVFRFTSEGIRWISIALAFVFIGHIFYYFYQACKKYTLGMFLVVLDNFALVVPIVLLLQGLRMKGFFAGYALSYVAFVIALILIVWFYNKKFPTKLDDLLLLPSEFYHNQDKQLHETVTTMDEVITLSERVIEFSKVNGISEKNSLFAGLAIEEMAGNVIKHGFNDGKSHYVDVSVTIDDNEVKIHICDDCRAFDPTKQLATDDSTDNLGIDLIAKIAKKFKYKNSTEAIPTGSAQYNYLLEQNNLNISIG